MLSPCVPGPGRTPQASWFSADSAWLRQSSAGAAFPLPVLWARGARVKRFSYPWEAKPWIKCRWITQAAPKEGSNGLKPANAAAMVCIALRHHLGHSCPSKIMFLGKAKPTLRQKKWCTEKCRVASVWGWGQCSGVGTDVLTVKLNTHQTPSGT